jgi:general L-amino acid transport system substrate-binding protein
VLGRGKVVRGSFPSKSPQILFYVAILRIQFLVLYDTVAACADTLVGCVFLPANPSNSMLSMEEVQRDHFVLLFRETYKSLGGDTLMKRRTILSFAGLLVLALALGACTTSGEQVEVTRIVEVEVAGETTTETIVEQVQAPGYGEILARVQDRGRLICGGRTDLLGFGYLDDDGRNIGIDIDLCRAVAAAVLGDPEAIELVPLTAAERGPAIQSGEIDVLTRNVTWTTSRDAQWGNFTVVMFYDGQGFMVPKDSGIGSGVRTLEELDGATVCVTTGTTTELNLASAFRQLGMALEVVSFEDTASVYNAL